MARRDEHVSTVDGCRIHPISSRALMMGIVLATISSRLKIGIPKSSSSQGLLVIQLRTTHRVRLREDELFTDADRPKAVKSCSTKATDSLIEKRISPTQSTPCSASDPNTVGSVPRKNFPAENDRTFPPRASVCGGALSSGVLTYRSGFRIFPVILSRSAEISRELQR